MSNGILFDIVLNMYTPCCTCGYITIYTERTLFGIYNTTETAFKTARVRITLP